MEIESGPVFSVLIEDGVVHVCFYDEAQLLARRLAARGVRAALRRATPREIRTSDILFSHGRASDPWSRFE